MKKDEKRVTIMDIPFVNDTQQHFVNHQLKQKITAEEKCFIVTANPEIVMETRDNKRYKKIVQRADYVVPDGIGVLIAARLQRKRLKERIAGVDLMTDLLHYANEQKLRCFFLGATDEVNAKARRNIREKFPNLIDAGGHHGYFSLDDKAVVEKAVAANADFVFVTLGFPKQEYWIDAYKDRFTKGVFIGLGGSLDIFAGNVKRAPNIWIKLHLEWLYRLLKQPFRWKRMLKAFSFLWLALWRK